MELNTANRPIRWKERIGILILGLAGNAVMVYGYNFLVYPWLMGHFGFVMGWFYAVLGSIILCLATLWFYDVTKQDWLGIETIKLIRDKPPSDRMGKFFYDITNKSDVVAFIFLSIKYDPFITVVYMRRGSGNHEMSARDWKIFWAGVVVSNAWWGILMIGALTGLEKWLPAPIFNVLLGA